LLPIGHGFVYEQKYFPRPHRVGLVSVLVGSGLMLKPSRLPPKRFSPNDGAMSRPHLISGRNRRIANGILIIGA
jgi:hypothetical protein